MAKKVAFEVTVPIYQSTVKSLIKEFEEHLDYEHEVKIKLKDNEALMALIVKGMSEQLLDLAEYLYSFDIVEPSAMR